ncbi:LuxR C-terminal-related transcriptional regulator [Actinophytocola gossypii]|uniref:LuxR family transcriptional regulator n=1 Tax=Actinophytocola gossypii TaxID=2812003 RepID=A0ABT2JJI6_9PSEU|nr:LuxR C-terminal-related transcriptional regulator [Actinophytocola gossypii]MCT2588045.1 LuxR family transcriptional regulator [Actinophytocola gossypii]
MSPILDRAIAAQVDTVAADRRPGAHVGIVAPGGYGKTTLLQHLGTAVHAATGTEPVIALPPFDQVTDGVLLVDDAHQLDDADLRDLRRIATTTPVRLVVAARPWPRRGPVAELLDLVQDQLLLAPFDAAQVRAALPARLRTDRHAEFVHAQTGGVPAFVDRLARALDGELDVPTAALAGFHPELARLDESVLRFLLAAEAGVALNRDLLVDLLDTGPGATDISDVVEAARATGLVGTAGALVPIAQRAIRLLIPVERRAWIRQRLAELQLARGGPVLPLMRPLAGTGIGGDGAAAAFETAAAEALPTDPALAARLYAAAVTAGRAPVDVAARRAEALALAGDLDGALRLADQVITTDNAPDRRAAATVAAAALAHRGQLGRSAELYRWAGADHFAALGSIGVGELTEPVADDGPPTSLSSALSLMAQGMHESVVGRPMTALSTMVRAAATLEPVGRGVLLPDSPAALGALLALHYGELGTATSLLERATAAGTGGAPLATRHRLLLAWIAMARGDLTRAADGLAAARRAPSEPRDALFAVAIELGVARRAGDAAGLGRAWLQAGEAVLRHPVDLFTFLPLGELTVAAARVRDEGRVAAHLAEARALLARLGDPPLWAVPLWWGGLHAAIVAGQPDVAEEHAESMAKAAARDEQFGTVATAARCWLDVTAGTVDADAVEDAARGLQAAGFTWDAARLAGHAATRTADRTAMVRLLDCARVIQGKPVSTRRPSSDPEPAPEVSLSDRELQVAELVVSGLTYKDVGDRLFISAKTVEHHVARMRQRLGASSRSELLSQLRTLVGSGGVRE